MQNIITSSVETENSQSTVMKPTLLIVGSGMATGRLLDEIIQRSPNKYNITVIGEEPHGSYNRILLSSVLAKETHYKNIIQKTPQWYEEHNITFVPDMRVTNIDRDNQTVHAISTITEQTIPTVTQQNNTQSINKNLTFPYEKLVLAVGSRAAKIPAKNQNIDGIFSFRNIADTQKIEAFSKGRKTAVVIGGGLLGLEAAYGLAISGIQVTLVHRNQWLLNRQLDKVAGDMLKKVMLEKNINFALGEEVVEFKNSLDSSKNKVLTGLTLTNGQHLPADIVIIATGITPNAELGKEAGLNVNRAIIVDDYMQTSDPLISALGECCEHNQATFGLVDPIWAQCQTLATRLTSLHRTAFVNAPVATKLKVSGVQLFSAGIVESSSTTQSFTLLDDKAGIYRKLIIKNDRIVGIVLFGDVSSGMNYFDLMQEKVPVNAYLPTLLLGYEYLESMKDELTQTNKVA